VSLLLEYTPSARITPLKACAHPFFDELRMEGNHTLPNGREMPPLFNFTEHGKLIDPLTTTRLILILIVAHSIRRTLDTAQPSATVVAQASAECIRTWRQSILSRRRSLCCGQRLHQHLVNG